MGDPGRYCLLDHTADLRVQVRGRDLPDLFANAGFALFDLLTDVELVRGLEPDDVSVAVPGGDREDLLVEWLRELLYRYHASGRLCCRIESPAVTDTSAAGRTWGEAADPARHRPKHEIKAITYHGLLVREESGGWVAEVVMDV